MIQKKWFAGLCCLLLFSQLAVAQLEEPRVTEDRMSFLSIDIFINEDGSATIREQYFFNFFAGEASQFVRDFEENTPSLLEWKADYPFIQPHIGNESQTENIEFVLSTTVEGQPSLTLSYKYPEGIVNELVSENPGRSTSWKLSDVVLVQFINSGSILIDDATQIKIHLPPNSVIDKEALGEEISIADNVITLTNFQSNALNVKYSILLPIANPIDTSRFLEDFINSPLFVALLVLLGLVLAYGMLNKKKITDRIEEYVVRHSELKPATHHEIEGILESEPEE
jgi:hypothetical protein